MKNIKLLFTLVLMTITVLGTSCSDWLDDISPRHAIPQSALTDDDLEKLLNGVYATMENYTFTFWWLDDIQGENFKAGPGGGQITDPCEMSPSYTNQAINILSFWRNSFTTLHQVNFLVETYEASENKESALMKKVGGVSYYFRAFIYYRLASHYGNVPILRKRSKEVVPISPEAEVWTFIEEDLGKAIRLLSKADSKWYVSSDAANALAARVALFQNKMTDAANYAEAVLANSSFSLASTAMDFSKNWVAGNSSPEIIFAYVNNSRASSPLNFTLYVNDTDGSWNYAPSDWCYNSLFADDNTLSRKGDVRLKATFTSQDANRVIKYPNGTYQLAETSDYTCTPVVISRISEMYLIKAEAEAMGGNLSGGKSTLENFVRTYRDPSFTSKANSAQDFQDEVWLQRRMELWGEGFSLFDILRLKKPVIRKNTNYDPSVQYNSAAEAQILIYRIPQCEMETNSGISDTDNNPAAPQPQL